MDYTDSYESFRNSSDENRRLLLQEELILDVTESLAQEMESQNLSQKEVAKRMEKTRGYISQLLGGGKNLTLRTIADVADALDCKAKLLLRRRHHGKSNVVDFPMMSWEEDTGFDQARFEGIEDKIRPTATGTEG